MRRQRISLRVSGRVQGVGFRSVVQELARSLGGVTGWVRNCSDGTVEVVAEGTETGLSQLVQEIRKLPLPIGVLECREIRSEATGEFSEFLVKPSV